MWDSDGVAWQSRLAITTIPRFRQYDGSYSFSYSFSSADAPARLRNFDLASASLMRASKIRACDSRSRASSSFFSIRSWISGVFPAVVDLGGVSLGPTAFSSSKATKVRDHHASCWPVKGDLFTKCVKLALLVTRSGLPQAPGRRQAIDPESQVKGLRACESPSQR